jgi:hypothetical protein
MVNQWGRQAPLTLTPLGGLGVAGPKDDSCMLQLDDPFRILVADPWSIDRDY